MSAETAPPGAAAPQAASVVIDLIRDGFYTGTACHRMSDAPTAEFIQCGSANGDGTGDFRGLV